MKLHVLYNTGCDKNGNYANSLAFWTREYGLSYYCVIRRTDGCLITSSDTVIRNDLL